MKIPFNEKFLPKIESGEYKVETKSGFPAKIIHCDGYGEAPILVTVDLGDGCGVQTRLYFADGKLYKEESDADLFIITPEPELSELEKRIRFTIGEVVDGRYNADNIEDVKGIAKGLLSLARAQFIKDGYVIEKKAFHDAVEKIDDKNKAEMSIQYSLHCKVENGTRHAVMNWEAFQKVAQKFIDIGKAETLKEIEQDPESSYDAFKRGFEYGKEEALKDLPRWDDCWRTSLIDKPAIINQFLVYKGRKIILADLEKLPGFNE